MIKALQPSIRMVGIFLPIVFAGLATYLLWRWHLTAGGMPPPESIRDFFTLVALRSKFFDCGPIPLFILGTFLFGLLYLGRFYMSRNFKLKVFLLQLRFANENQKLDQLIANPGPNIFASGLKRLIDRYRKDQDLQGTIALKADIVTGAENDMALDLMPVKTAEWMLPLIGFLGTVLGIGGAIGGVRDGVQQLFAKGKLDAGVLRDFNAGFSQMALAFDTTFQGLGCLMILGTCHFFVRRGVAATLSQASDTYTSVMEMMRVEEKGTVQMLALTSLNEATNGLRLDMTGVQQELAQLHESMTRTQAQQRRFHHMIIASTEQVIDKAPQLKWMKDILFEHVVEFDAFGKRLATRIVASCSKAFPDQQPWQIDQVASITGDRSLLVILRQQQAWWLLAVDPEENETAPPPVPVPLPFLKAPVTCFPSSIDGIALVASKKWLIGFDSTGARVDRVPKIELVPDDEILGLPGDGQGMLVRVRRKDGMVSIFGQVLGEQEDPELLQEIPFVQRPGNDPAHALLLASHAGASSLAVATRSADGWHIRMMTFSLARKDDKKARVGMATDASLSCRLDLAQIEILREGDEGELVLCDRKGGLYFWNRTRNQVLPLKHRSLRPLPGSRIIPGGDGWFALVGGDRLTMWNLSMNGYISPCEGEHPEGMDINVYDTGSMVASADRRYLFATCKSGINAPGLLGAWRFPQYRRNM